MAVLEVVPNSRLLLFDFSVILAVLMTRRYVKYLPNIVRHSSSIVVSIDWEMAVLKVVPKSRLLSLAFW